MTAHPTAHVRGCPYCPYQGTNAGRHVRKRHSDKPAPSDKKFPGWREVESLAKDSNMNWIYGVTS